MGTITCMPHWTFPTFATPDVAWALLLLPAVVFLWAYSRRQRHKALEAWGSSSFWSPVSRRLGRWLLFLLLATIIVGLMSLQWGKETITPTTAVRDLFLIVDVSQSMLAEDRPPLSRLQRSKQAMLELIATLQQTKSQTRVGLIAFAGNSKLLSPPTLDLQHIQQLIEGLSTESLGTLGRLQTVQENSIGTSFSAVVPLLKTWDALHADARESIEGILISDGDDLSDGVDESLWNSVPYRIHAFAIGDSSKAWPIPYKNGYLMVEKADGTSERVLTQRRDESLTTIAKLRSGSFLGENGASQALVDWWRKQSSETPTRLLESQSRVQPIPRTVWLVGIAGILLLLEVAFGGVRQRRW
jgi:hypothetical protein